MRLAITCLFLLFSMLTSTAAADNSVKVPILTYHNFDPSVPGSITISTAKFEEQLKYLKDSGHTVIPLQDLVSYLEGKKSSLPEKSVVITVDDGKESVYRYMQPLVKKYNVPVTLFIYPSAISNASYALTWDQIKELQKTGLFDIQSHTYWHPDFKREKQKQSPEEYQQFVQKQLVNSKKTIEEKLGTPVTLLAWPFGIYDEYLEQAASKAGYVMAFSIDARPADKAEHTMAQPRYLILESQGMKTFEGIVN
jgi:peptidoglycan/xylan/chitin deacetylase (PgdA/CDA1 family)